MRLLVAALMLAAFVGCGSRPVPVAHGLLLELPPGYRGLVRVTLDERAPMPTLREDDWVVAVPRAGAVSLHPLPSVEGWRGARCAWRDAGAVPDGGSATDETIACWQLGRVLRGTEATSAHDLLIGTRHERDAAVASPEGYELGDVAALRRYHALAGIGRAAIGVGDSAAGAAAGRELLALADEFRGWDYGNAIHDGNELLGLVALRAGDTAGAAKSLLAAGATPGSAKLATDGPSLRLARELLARGERDAVVAYLEQCRRFWPDGAARVAGWQDAIRAGTATDLGAATER